MARTMRKTVAPVTFSPAQMERCTGAAPRHWGSREKCRLYQPIGSASSTSCFRILPYATTAAACAPVAASSDTNVSSLGSDSMTGRPSSSAACLTGFATSLRPRPVGASGLVSTATTSKCSVSWANSFNDGTATSGVPANSTFNMRRISSPFISINACDRMRRSRIATASTTVCLICVCRYFSCTAGIATPASISRVRNARASLNRTPRMPASFAPTMFIALSSTNSAPEASMPNCFRA